MISGRCERHAYDKAVNVKDMASEKTDNGKDKEMS